MKLYYIDKAKQVYKKKSFKRLIHKSGIYVFERIVPPNISLRLTAMKYRVMGHNGIGDLSYVYYINPQKISRVVLQHSLPRPASRFSIIDGDWHKQAIPHEELTTHQMLVEHFEHGKKWKDTSQYEQICEKISNGVHYGRLDDKNQSVSRLNDYLNYIDKLYNSIESDGYKRQNELSSESDFLNRNTTPYLNEIQVCVGPDGEIYHKLGGHRLTIAKILDVNKIPVRTRVRHVKWQKKRNEIAKSSNKNRSLAKFRKHPELNDII